LSNGERSRNLIPGHFHDYTDRDDHLISLKGTEDINVEMILSRGSCADMSETDNYFAQKVTLNLP
jgi:hypothetical protein